jgi:cytochrome c oxidase cbb3-type subunit 4
MDLNDLRIAVTLMSLVLFIALVVHTWSRRRTAEHDVAAHLPFVEDEPATEDNAAARQRGTTL